MGSGIRWLPAYAVLAVALLLAVYPNKRIVHWVELGFDWDWGGQVAAHQAFQNFWWAPVFEEPDSRIVTVLQTALRCQKETDIVELGGGSGFPPSVWAQRLRDSGTEVKVKLTDWRPNLDAWKKLQGSFPDLITYSSEPVDAMNVSDTIKGIRMEHMMVHHLKSDEVTKLLADVVRRKSVLIIGEPWPNRQNVLTWPVYAVTYRARALWQGHVTELVKSDPSQLILQPLFGIHDSLVTVLRAHSPTQLEEAAARVDGAEDYAWTFYGSGSTVALCWGQTIPTISSWIDALLPGPMIMWGVFASKETLSCMKNT